MDLTPADRTRLIFTPNPVTCDGQRNIAAQLVKGETLSQFLARNVPEDMGHGWEVRINGVVVPVEVMSRVRPKDGTIIEVRSLVKKQALYIVAMVALAYFTVGIGSAVYGAAGVGGMMFSGATAATLANVAIFAAGSILINKVLGPKPPKVESQSQDNVYSLGAARNQARHYQPVPLLFGRVKAAPDVLSLPYTWHEGNDQYLGMVLTPGFNVGRIEALSNGDTPLSSYDEVAVYHKGFSGMPSEDIPLFANANTIAGGELFKPDPARHWVVRATPVDTVRVQLNLEYLLGDQTSKGKPYTNNETIEVQYRPTGTTDWLPLVSRRFSNADFNPKRATISADVAKGQYDIRASRVGQAMDIEGQNGRAQFQWTTLTSVQSQEGGYTGLPQIGIRMKATGQLNGAPDEIRGEIVSKPCPVWNGTSWVTQETSNPGAHALLYARGIYDEDGKLVAGIGLDDEMIDIEAFKGFMLHCAANNYTYDFHIKDPRSHDEMLSSLTLVGMGQHTWASGKLSVAWAAADQPLSGVVNMATIKRGQFQVDYTLANMADGIEYTYFDASKWDTGIVRVSSPGVDTPLNPASVSGEGVTTAAHAAELARWHMAQSLYQYKDISFSTDLEHLSYRRMSLLALQHDLTQWGYGGRVQAAVDVNGVVSIQLDEPVPAPSSGTAYVGLRIPGERAYRVFPVAPFTGETTILTLAESWPLDAPLPGDDADNPPHDTIWIYDFKATPGYKVRVVGIQPEGDMKGASVAVVPESPEYWDYIKNGTYAVPPNASLLASVPTVSSLVVSIGTEAELTGEAIILQASFDVSGPYDRAEVYSALLADGVPAVLVKVAETRTNLAQWKPAVAGNYLIRVVPFGHDGRRGIADSATFTVPEGGLFEAPQPLEDVTATPVADGVLVRWHTLGPGEWARIEIAEGPTGPWRPLHEVKDGTQYLVSMAEGTAFVRAIRVKNDVDSAPVSVGEVAPNLLIDAISAAAAEATEKVNAAKAEANARANALQAQINDVVGTADEWVETTPYPKGDSVRYAGHLYRAKVDVPANTPPPNATYWEDVGNYASVGEAVAAAVSMGVQNANDIAAEVQRVDGMVARFPAGNGPLASEAMVADEATARASADAALSTRTSVIEARMPTGTGALATATAVDSVSASVEVLEAGFSEVFGWQFAGDAKGFTAAGGTLEQWPATLNEGAIALASTTSDPYIASPVFSLEGRSANIVRARLRYRGGLSADNLLYWATEGHGFSGAEGMQAFYTTPFGPAALGEWFTAEWDMSDNADWNSSIITRLRLDLTSAAQHVDVAWVTIGRRGDGAAGNTLRSSVQRTSAIEARMPTGTDQLANEARVVAAENASASRDDALSQRTSVVEATVNNPVSGVAAIGAIVNDQKVEIHALKQSFSSVMGWDFVGDGNYKGWTATNAEIAMFPPSAGGALAAGATAPDPSFTSPTFSHRGAEATLVRAKVRLRGGAISEGQLYWATDTFGFGGTAHVVWRVIDTSDGWLIVEWDMASNPDWTSRTITRLRLDIQSNGDGVSDIQWVALGRLGSGSSGAAIAANVQQTTALNLAVGGVNGAAVSSTTLTYRTGVMEASKVEFLKVGNKVAGYRIGNDGLATNFELVADSIELLTGANTGVTITRNKMDRKFGSVAFYEGDPFGPDNLVEWRGPASIPKHLASKANAGAWTDSNNDSYFAGRVLQGILRWFQSTTSTANNAEITTGSNPRLNKPTSVSARYSFDEMFNYRGGSPSVVEGPGLTEVVVVIERRYGSGAWSTLLTRRIRGVSVAYSPGYGEDASWTSTISGELFVTDVASNQNSEYRARIASRSVQSHTASGHTVADAVQIAQYLSIEVME